MDKKAKAILFKTYWSSAGWKSEHATAPGDFAYAKEKGLMFDPVSIAHDDCVDRVIETVRGIPAEKAARAFLCSLSTRRLDWRSAIASHHIAELLTPHRYKPAAYGFSHENGGCVPVAWTCGICRELKDGRVSGRECYAGEDVNVLNFERIKWGGVRHGQLIYALFDLQQFAKEEIPGPAKADMEIFKGMLRAIDSCEPNDYPGILRDKLKDIPGFKSDKSERTILLDILACVEVLKPASNDRPEKGKHDWNFVAPWRGEDGSNAEAVEKYFGKYLR